jgi:hypothetical protein
MNEVKIQDYTVEQSHLDWAVLLEEWSWLLPADSKVLLLTRAGDLFLQLADRSVHMLDVGVGELQRVAADQKEFDEMISNPKVAREWLMIPIVDQLVASGLGLGLEQCYGFRKLPIFGGTYSAENRVVLPIREHLGASGSLHRQVADLPDGAKVRIELTE